MVAAGSVALTILVYVLNARFDHTWGKGIHLVYTAAAALFVIGMALRTRVDEDRPAAWQSVLYVVSYVLALLALVRLATVFSVDDPLNSSGTVVWMGLILLGLAAWFATARNSGISLLLAVVTSIIVVLAFVDWVFSPDGPETFRWVLLVVALVLFAGGVTSRGEDPRRSVAYVNGAGLALLALAFSFLGASLVGALNLGGGAPGTGWGWELVILVGGFALLVYSAHERQSGPGYLGVANLFAFALLASPAGDDGPSLIGWPLVLILLTATLVVAGLRGDVQRR